MIPIYRSQSTLDAQFVQDLLATAGIAAFVLGPAAAGALADGDVPGEVRVVVEDGEADLARVMVQEWQTMPAEDDDDDAPEPGDADEVSYELDVDEFDLVDSLPLDAE